MTLKPASRVEVMRDAEYFATELSHRLERLVDLEPSGRVGAEWQQAAAVVRRTRGLARRELDETRRRAKRARRAE